MNSPRFSINQQVEKITMLNIIKKISSQVLANTIVVSADQYIRSHIEGIVRDRRAAKQAKNDRNRVR